MDNGYMRQGPLDYIPISAELEADQGGNEATVVLEDRGFRGQIVLQGKASDAEFFDAVSDITGLRPSKETNVVTGGPGFPRLLWLGPEEWLLVTEDEESGRIMLELTNSFKGRHVQVVDNSDAYAIVGVTGASARNILAKGCTLDLHERVFHSGCSTRTLLGQVQVILHQVTDDPDYEIHVHRSFAEFLWEWLVDAGQEYGLKTVRP